MSKENPNELEHINMSKYLDVLKTELEVRREEVNNKKEIQLVTLHNADEDSKRSFEAFKIETSHKKDDKKFIRRISYIALFTLIGVVGFGAYLIVIILAPIWSFNGSEYL